MGWMIVIAISLLALEMLDRAYLFICTQAYIDIAQQKMQLAHDAQRLAKQNMRNGLRAKTTNSKGEVK